MAEITSTIIDVGYELQKALFQRDFERFRMILLKESCSPYDLNICLAFSAAIKQCGHFSRALMDAGADRQFYLNGRLDRSAIRGDIAKIDRWYAEGADPLHNSCQPVRAGLFAGQENAVYYLVSELRCSFQQATKPEVMGSLYDLDNKQEIDILMARVRSKIGSIISLGEGDVRRFNA